MRIISILSVVILLASCSKKDDPSGNKTGVATFIFSPGGAETQISYYSFEEGRQIIETKTAFYQVRETVKVGDQIKLGMQTFGNPVGNFSLRLMINDEEIRTEDWEGGTAADKTLYLMHTVSAQDLN